MIKHTANGRIRFQLEMASTHRHFGNVSPKGSCSDAGMMPAHALQTEIAGHCSVNIFRKDRAATGRLMFSKHCLPIDLRPLHVQQTVEDEENFGTFLGGLPPSITTVSDILYAV